MSGSRIDQKNFVKYIDKNKTTTEKLSRAQQCYRWQIHRAYIHSTKQ